MAQQQKQRPSYGWKNQVKGKVNTTYKNKVEQYAKDNGISNSAAVGVMIRFFFENQDKKTKASPNHY